MILDKIYDHLSTLFTKFAAGLQSSGVELFHVVGFCEQNYT